MRTTSFLAITALGLTGAAHAQLSPNQQGVATAIATPAGGVTANTLAVQTSLAGLAPADVPGAYSQFTPAGYSLLPDLTFRTAEFEESSIRQYLRDFRAGGTGVPGSPVRSRRARANTDRSPSPAARPAIMMRPPTAAGSARGPKAASPAWICASARGR